MARPIANLEFIHIAGVLAAEQAVGLDSLPEGRPMTSNKVAKVPMAGESNS